MRNHVRSYQQVDNNTALISSNTFTCWLSYDIFSYLRQNISIKEVNKFFQKKTWVSPKWLSNFALQLKLKTTLKLLKWRGWRLRDSGRFPGRVVRHQLYHQSRVNRLGWCAFWAWERLAAEESHCEEGSTSCYCTAEGSLRGRLGDVVQHVLLPWNKLCIPAHIQLWKVSYLPMATCGPIYPAVDIHIIHWWISVDNWASKLACGYPLWTSCQCVRGRRL